MAALGLDQAIWLLWFLRLFKPEWILSFYVPGIAFARSIYTLLLYGTFVVFLFKRPLKLEVDKTLLAFLIVHILSTVFAENRGVSYNITSGLANNLVFSFVSVNIISSEKQLNRLLCLYVWSMAFYAIVGVSNKGLVPFHVVLDNEDAFGPFMAMGLLLSSYAAFQGERVNKTFLLIGGLCVLGVVSSMARGAFIGLCGAVFFVWYKSRKKISALFVIGIIAFLVFVSSSLFFKNNEFWQEMASISTSGAHGKTEDPRIWLWQKAIVIFVNNPILGAGPRCYGFVLPKITSQDEVIEHGIHFVGMFGRVPHNIYFQVAAELGILGIFVFAAMLMVFFKKNKQIQTNWRSSYPSLEGNQERNENLSLSRMTYFRSLALQGAMFTFLVCGCFYDTLYAPWLVDLLIFNYLNYQFFQHEDTGCALGLGQT